MKSRLLRGGLLIVAVILAGFVAQRLVATRSVTGRLVSSEAVAMLGSGSSAAAVTGDGTIVAWLPSPEAGSLPELPLDSTPKGGHLEGTALQQVQVLAAAPPALRPYLARSSYGESGVDVELTTGIELRFGDALGATRKWRAAAAVLADPEVTSLDYIDLHAPSRPAIHGSGHALPPLS